MPTVTRQRHPKPFFPILVPNTRLHKRGSFNRRISHIAKPSFGLTYGSKEYTLHSTKGWRCRTIPAED